MISLQVRENRIGSDLQESMRDVASPKQRGSLEKRACGCHAHYIIYGVEPFAGTEVVLTSLLVMQDAASLPSSFLPPYPHRHLDSNPSSASPSAAGSPTEPTSQVSFFSSATSR